MIDIDYPDKNKPEPTREDLQRIARQIFMLPGVNRLVLHVETASGGHVVNLGGSLADSMPSRYEINIDGGEND